MIAISTRVLDPWGGPTTRIKPMLAVGNIDSWMTMREARAFAKAILREADRCEKRAARVRARRRALAEEGGAGK